ncbi:MAG TPA: hypothetical protein VLI67_07960 [Vicinamibacteria bacterium]|nr:hypothetical protein [Vicinamibacteria bacterium]
MTATTTVRYLGFESTPAGRDYALSVRRGEVCSQVIVRIPHAAFAQHLTRYQDAPDICFLKVQQELALHDDHPPVHTLIVSNAELAAYRTSHEKQPGRRATPAPPAAVR